MAQGNTSEVVSERHGSAVEAEVLKSQEQVQVEQLVAPQPGEAVRVVVKDLGYAPV